MSISKEEEIQILYEIAFGFDNQSSIKANLRKTLSTILKRLNCSGGAVLKLYNEAKVDIEFQHLFSIPTFYSKNGKHIDFIKDINKEVIKSGKDVFYNSLPKEIKTDMEDSIFILGLSHYGIILLTKKNSTQTTNIIKSLKPVLEKIGESCLHHLQHEELEQSRERLKNFYVNAPTALYQIDYSGNFIHMNSACKKLLGLGDEEDFTETSIKYFYHSRTDRFEFLKQFKKDSVLKNFEVRLKRKNGQPFIAKVNANAIRNKDEEIIYFEGNLEDITTQKEIETQLRNAKELAEKSERLQSEFLAQISHEIRTPINTILNFTAILKEELDDYKTENSDFSFAAIYSGAGRLLRTINLVLNYSEVEAGIYDLQNEAMDLKNDLILPLLQEFSPMAKENDLQLNYTSHIENPLTILADKYTTSQILINLVSNAIKYTMKGKVELITKRDNNNIFISVKDSGIGIAKEYLPKIFDKFSQEEGGYTRKYEGNGLGLALVKKYCDLNNYSITAKSKKDLGTTFTLKIPLDITNSLEPIKNN